MTKSAHVVLWDADGVIFNTFDTDKNWLWSKTIEADLGVTEKTIQCLFGEDFHLVIQGKLDTRLHVEACFKKNGISIPADDFIAYWLEKDASLNNDILDIMKKHKSYVATNQELLRAAHMETILSGAVQKIFASSRIGVMKPDPEFFAYIERDLRLPPDQLHFIDDTLQNVEAARSRGWQAYHFTGIDSLPDFLND